MVTARGHQFARVLAGLALFAGSLPAFAQQPAETSVENSNAQHWLTHNEQAWLREHRKLTHGVLSNHEPFEFTDETGAINGLTSDYIAIIGERLGIEMEVVRVDGFAELSTAMRNGEIHLASYLPMWPELETVFAWSEPVISMPIAVFGRQDAALLLDIPALSQWRVAVEKPSRAMEIFSREWPDLEFEYVDSAEEGLLALQNNRIDYFIHNVFSVEYFGRELGTESLRIALQTPYSFDIRLATSEDFAPLVPMIHKVMAGLSDHERTLIFDKWVNLQTDTNIDWRSTIGWGAAFLAVVLSVLATIIMWNRRLTREVAARTRDLEASREDMRALALHMDRIREEEKSSIALEMHDELGHSLTALTMSIRRLGGTLKKNPPGGEDATEDITELLQLVKQASATSRRIMSDLRPSVLNDLGLVAAIEWLAHEFESRYDVTCEIDAKDLEIELGDDALIALFRITQESLTNVAKHARASAAKVSLRVDDESLQLQISDDGIGIPPEWRNKGASFGLLGMRERALALGGELQVSRGESRGCLVRVCIPLDPSLQAERAV